VSFRALPPNQSNDTLKAALLHERVNVDATDKVSALPVCCRKPSRDPSADRLLTRADNVRELSDRVVAMDFDAAVGEPPRHRSFHSVNEGADVVYSPSCRARLPSRRGPTDVVGSGAKEEPQCLIVLDGPQQSAESVRSGDSRTRSNGRPLEPRFRDQVSPTARQLAPGLALTGPPPAIVFPFISQIEAWPLVF
jgi:hypothetical protein